MSTPTIPIPLPEVGKYHARDWATILDVSLKTIVRQLEEFQIPHTKLHTLVVIDAAIYWKYAPMQFFDEEKDEKTSGKKT